MVEFAAVLLMQAALVYAALRDLVSFQIPNWLSLAIAADFLAAALAGPTVLSDIGWHLSAGLAALAVGALLFWRGMIGGGDAKLLAACAVWAGWSGFVPFILAVTVLGGVLTVLIVIFRRAELTGRWAGRAWIRRLHSGEKGVPYGVAIGLGGLVTLGGAPVSGAAGWGALW